MLHPKTDIRSMFNKTPGQNYASEVPIMVTEAMADVVVPIVVVPPAEKKKAIKRDEIDVLCDSYYKAYTGDKCKGIVNHDVASVKETLKEIEKCKVKPKKLYRYFHHVKVSSKDSDAIFPIEYLLLHPFQFITFEHQFISYKEAMSICAEKGLTPQLEVRRNAWIYDYFIGKQNKLYISETESQQLLIDFNKEFAFYNRNAAQSLLLKGYIVERMFGSNYYYTTQEFIDFEIKTSDKVMKLFYHESDEADEAYEKEDKAINAHIENYTMKQHETKDEFKFEPEQVEAIKRGCRLNKMQLFNITGPPGTGKSTIVDCIVGDMLQKGNSIAIMAPTGLAQKNLKNSCKCNPKFSENIMFSTLHRALNFTFKDKKNKFKPTTMIVDESSMVDLFLFNKLLCACERFQCSLILIGDVKQLPPISAGTPFESIINSKIFDTTVLTNIKRQNGNLKTIIEKLNTPNGVHYDDFDNICSTFIEAKTPEDFERVITEIYKKEMMQKVGIHTMCVQREKTAGVFSMNPIIQKLKNPNGEELFVKRYEGAHTHIFHEGDLVIRTENDYKDEDNVRVNGDVGTIHQTKMKVKRFGKDVYDYKYTIKYETGKEEEGLTSGDVQDAFMPFYASSVHKMQGLQETVIVFIVSPAHNYCLTNENSKKLVYTAISRCRANFYVVGDKSLFLKAQRSKIEFTYPTLFMIEFKDYE
jgi:ABC-type dipeptide/oligopeptide/nickel transport system ATPase subunit